MQLYHAKRGWLTLIIVAGIILAPTMSTISTETAGGANSRKRRRRNGNEDEMEDEDDGNGKDREKQQTQTSLQAGAEKLKLHLDDLNDQINRCSLSEYGIIRALIKLCNEICDGDAPRPGALELLRGPLEPVEEEDILTKIPQRTRVLYTNYLEKTRITLQGVATLYRDLLEIDTYPPSASSYAQPAVWAEWQQKPNAILNLRPSNNQSLPISTLHPIFARFRATLKQSLPKTTDTLIVHHVAYDLCIKMANSFKDEKSRRKSFEECIKPLFKEYSFVHEVLVESELESHSSKAGLLVYLRDRPVIGGENKLESGDAYMQVSRVYQTWINAQKKGKATELTHGAPMILLCLIGPLLIVAGGFYDGEHVIVEPLAEPCLMLPDHHRDRQEQLMHVLVAIREASENLASLDFQTAVFFKPATPRIYPTFTTFDNQTQDLTFTSRLIFRSKGPDPGLLFTANTTASPKPVLVKLIADGRYGRDAHQILAAAGYAPRLLGSVSVDGAHTAYVMEYLSPGEGWITLREYMQSRKDSKSHINGPLEQLIEVMKDKNIAHGDLRPNNIMIMHVQGTKPEVKVIDFDWAGTSGMVRYPWQRNEDIRWPVGADEPILTDHDHTLLMSYLKS